MSGKVVPATNIYLKTAPASAGNAILEVFAPGGNNLGGLAQIAYSTGATPPPFSAAITPTLASGNLNMSFFAGKSVFLAVPTTLNVAAISTTTLTPTLSGGGGTSYQIAVGTSAGTSNTVGWTSATTATQITALAFTQGTSYYISAYTSNATNSTTSLATSNTAAYGIPNLPVSPTITLTSLTNWSLGWSAPAGIAPTTYSYILSNTTDSTVFTSGTTSLTSVSGSTALTQAKNYAVYVSSVRPEASSANVNSTSSSLAAPGAPTTYTVSAITTANYTPNVSGGTGTYYVILGTVSGGTTPTASWSSGTVSQVSTVGTSYYLTAITSNTTTGTKSAQFTSAAVGIPNLPVSPTITLTSLTNWSLGWSAPAGIAPTTYSYILSNTTDSTVFTSGTTSLTSVSGSTALTQAKNYAVYVSSVRPEASSANVNSTSSSLAAPGAPTTYTVSAITTANYTPNVSGGTGTYYVILGTVSGGTTPTASWSSGTVSQVSTVGTSYYLTAITSNTTTGTKSAQFTSAAVGIPNLPASATLTITSLSNWSLSWTAPSSGIAPTGYSWSISTSSTTPNPTGGYFGTTTGTTATGTAVLTGGTTYYATVIATRPEASSGVKASAGVLSLNNNIVSKTSAGNTTTSGAIGTNTIGFNNSGSANTYSVTIVATALSGSTMYFTYNNHPSENVQGASITIYVNGLYATYVDNAYNSPQTTSSYPVPSSGTHTIRFDCVGGSESQCCGGYIYYPVGGATILIN